MVTSFLNVRSTIRIVLVLALFSVLGFHIGSIIFRPETLQTPSSIYSSTNVNQTQDDGFTQVKSLLYQLASNPEHSRAARTSFVLNETWPRANGGLTDEDRKTLGELYFHAESVFEYGLGESTLIAAAVDVPRFSGVDSDAEWVAQARSNSNKPHFRFHFADIGDTKSWGYPKTKLRKNAYSFQVAALVGEEEAFDVYLIDGRYRVACVCVAFLHAMQYGGDMEKVRVGIHDNHDLERGYKVVSEIGELVVQNEMLWVYKLKKGTNVDDVVKLWKSNFQTEE